MQLGIFAKTFPGQAPGAVLEAAAAAGFSCVQYNMACSGLAAMPDAVTGAQAQAVASASVKTKIAISAVSGTYNMIHPDLALRQAGHRRLAVLAARCRDMNTRMITLCTGTRDPDDQWRHHPANRGIDAWRDLLSSMTVALEIADRHDIELGIEPELSNVVHSAARARDLLAELRSPRLKIVIDAANLFEQESQTERRYIVASAIDLLGDRIAMAHAKDRLADGKFVAAGKGVLDYGHYLSCLKAVGFHGPLVTHGLSAEEASPVAAFLRTALEYVGVEVL